MIVAILRCTEGQRHLVVFFVVRNRRSHHRHNSQFLELGANLYAVAGHREAIGAVTIVRYGYIVAYCWGCSARSQLQTTLITVAVAGHNLHYGCSVYGVACVLWCYGQRHCHIAIGVRRCRSRNSTVYSHIGPVGISRLGHSHLHRVRTAAEIVHLSIGVCAVNGLGFILRQQGSRCAAVAFLEYERQLWYEVISRTTIEVSTI